MRLKRNTSRQSSPKSLSGVSFEVSFKQSHSMGASLGKRTPHSVLSLAAAKLSVLQRKITTTLSMSRTRYFIWFPRGVMTLQHRLHQPKISYFYIIMNQDPC